MVGERDLLQNAFGAILVERSPASVAALEGQHPIQSAFEAGVALLRIISRHFAQGQKHHCGVVNIRVPFVVEFEHPAAWLDLGRVLVLPIAAEPNLLGEQPLSGSFQRRMIVRKT